MELYRCYITLQDYLFFATTERGKVAETGPFIRHGVTKSKGHTIVKNSLK
jgi:hypothetical protein